MSMAEKIDRFDQCMKLADFWIARYYARLQFEWKVTLGLWALLAAGTVFLIDKNIPYLALWAIVVIVGHVFWIQNIWAANERNFITAYFWANEATKILRNPKYQIKIKPRRLTKTERWAGGFKNWAVLFQLGTTVILVALAYVLAGSKIIDGPG